MSLQEIFSLNTPLIKAELDSLLDVKKTSELDELSVQCLNDIFDFAKKGKMLRGNFVMLGHDIFGGSNKKAAAKIAAALELNQSGLLMHDDIMDNDRLRRGEMSMFAWYEDVGTNRNVGNHEEYGRSIAILLGDVAFFLSYEMLSNLDIDPKIALKVLNLYSKEMLVVSHGQLLDYDYGQTTYEPTVDEILRVYERKTGRYSCMLPFMLGALVAETSEENIQKIADYGKALGIVFQIKDDEIGLFGDQSQTGKPMGSDIRENKKTLIRSLLYKNAEPGDRNFFETCFGNKDVTENEVERIKAYAQEKKVFDEIQRYVSPYIQTARSSIESMELTQENKDVLSELIDYLSHRGK